MKKQSNLQRLLNYAEKRKALAYLAWVLSAASALVALVPFWYVWRILNEVIEVARGSQYHALRLAGGNIFGCGGAYLHCRTDVLAYVGISHCNKFANRNDRAYFHASHGEDRGIWER